MRTKKGETELSTAPRPRKTIDWERPWMPAYQTDNIFHSARYVVVAAATKVGKSLSCLIWLIEQACVNGGPGRNFWWVAPSTGQADVMFHRAVAYCPRSLVHPHFTHHTLRFPNGSMIWFKTGEKPDLLYGDDVYAAVLDEATRMRLAAWTAVRTTLTFTRAPVRIIGNVRGRKNWAYKLGRRAERQEAGMHYAKITAYDAAAAGILQYEEIEDAKRTMEPDGFQELFLAEATEGGSNPFGHDHIRACRLDDYSRLPTVAFGVDVARTHDWTVIVGLDKTASVTKIVRFQKPWPETEAEIKKCIGKVGTMLDSTGVGDVVLGHLQEAKANVEGFVYNARSKHELMLRLKMRIQAQTVHYPTEEGKHPDNEAVILQQELHSFEYLYTDRSVTYSAPDGEFDDAVNALALAVTQLELRPLPPTHKGIRATSAAQASPFPI